jgi:hypothetical protein
MLILRAVAEPFSPRRPKVSQGKRFLIKEQKKEIKILPLIFIYLFIFSSDLPLQYFFFQSCPPKLEGWLRPCLGVTSIREDKNIVFSITLFLNMTLLSLV